MASNRGNPRNPGANYFVTGGEMKNREQRDQSQLTLFKRVDPDNVALANCGPNFARDFSELAAVVPNGLSRAAPDDERPMNRGGRSSILPAGVEPVVVGGGQDDKGIF